MNVARSKALTEKYRPTRLKDLVGNPHVTYALQAIVNSGSIPHFLFFGPPGTGKTTAAKSICREVLKKADRNMMELNASDERGISVVRDKIKVFASTFGLASSMKIVILDEADSMTKDAQNALRRIIEIYSKTVRFIIICNYSTKIIPAIKSRCAPFRFGPIKVLEIKEFLAKIAREEGIESTEEGLVKLSETAGGDLRKAVNMLNGLAIREQPSAGLERVSEYCKEASREEICSLYETMQAGEFEEAKREIAGIRRKHRLGLKEVVNEIAGVVKDKEGENRHEKMAYLSEVEYRLARGGTEEVQENALLSYFLCGSSAGSRL